MALQRKISRAAQPALVGRSCPCWWKVRRTKPICCGRRACRTQAPEIDGVCYINDPGEAAPRAGEMRRMRITEAHDYDLVGELIDDSDVRRSARWR